MANVDAMVQQAVAAIKANNKPEGRRILEQVLAIDEYNEQGWLWLSGCVDTLEEQITCLENVLTVNPENQKAQKGIAAVKARLAGAPSARPAAPAAPPVAAPDPFANSPFAAAAPPPNPYGDAYEPDAWASPPPDAPRTTTSVEWGPAAAQPQPGRHVGQPSDEEYDQWVANLPIASNGSSARGGAVFTEDIFSVASGPFNAPEPEPEEQFSFDAASPFDSYNPVDTFRPDAEGSSGGGASFGSFSASLEAPAQTPAPEQAARPPISEMTSYDDLRFTDDEPDAEAQPDESETLDAGAFALHAGAWDAGNPFVGGRDVVLGSSASAMPSSGLFKAIPTEIQLGRAGEKASPGLIITTAILGLLNLAALIVLLNNLPR